MRVLTVWKVLSQKVDTVHDRTFGNVNVTKENMKYLFLINSVSRLSRRLPSHYHRQLSTVTPEAKQHIFPGEELDKELRRKVIYNSDINRLSFMSKKKILSKLEANEKANKVTDPILPLSLKYIDGYECPEPVQEPEIKQEELVQMPFRMKIIDPALVEYTSTDEKLEDDNETLEEVDDVIIDRNPNRLWMCDYEKYSETELDNPSSLDEWRSNYGTPDPSIPVSSTPCGGCGALLHCQNTSLPGYLPKEIFSECTPKDLRSLTCQRCHFLKHYNTALSVSVDPQYYPQLLSSIKDKKALVIVMVDLTDFPCSIWPKLLDIIGERRPLFIVGNKVDLLWGDSSNWMNHVKSLLRSHFPKSANVKHVCLISSKTGYGVEELINKLHNIWEYKGDVYLVGSTNVGKSTLFNALLGSDYCKVKAADLVQRATVAPWPGTTLNLLKFPILRPEGWRLHLRTQRLIKANKIRNEEQKLKREQMKSAKVKTPPQLIGNIERTFTKPRSKTELGQADTFSAPNRRTIQDSPQEASGLDPNDPDYRLSKWLYDSPGVLHHDQILDLLTIEEVMLTLPQQIIKPRTFQMRPGWSLFIGGLSRVDYIEGNENILFTVFSSHTLPVTITSIENAEFVYRELLGSEYLRVPFGPQERLKEWPQLQSGEEIKICGVEDSRSAVDIVLSSAGWISVTPRKNRICKLQPWTPMKRGIYVRNPPLLPYAVRLRGKRIEKIPAFQSTRPYGSKL